MGHNEEPFTANGAQRETLHSLWGTTRNPSQLMGQNEEPFTANGAQRGTLHSLLGTMRDPSQRMGTMRNPSKLIGYKITTGAQ